MSEKEEYEVVIHSSAMEFKDFLEGTIWADMKRELGIWLEGVRAGLENPETSDRDRLIDVGRADALRYFQALPETIRDRLVEKQTSHREESDEDENQEREELLDG